jgi:hypothetical protein
MGPLAGPLTGILLTFLLSASSLLVVFYRVSPLTAPDFALPFLFLSIFILVGSSTALLLTIVKAMVIRQSLRMRWVVASSIRQGMFVALATCLLLFLHLLHILNWWIALLVYTVFLLIEMAIGR